MAVATRALRAKGGRTSRGMPLEISERIRYWMKDREVSWAAMQSGLRARGLTVSESTMSRLLNGKSEPKIGTLAAIADVLDVTLRDLMPTPAAGSDGAQKIVQLPTAHWNASEKAIQLNGMGKGLGYLPLNAGSAQFVATMVQPGRHTVVIANEAANMAPMVEPGDILFVELDQDHTLADGSKVVIADPESGQMRLMWMHHTDDPGVVQYSDLSGYIVGSPELAQGRVHMVLRRPRRMRTPLPQPPKGGWRLIREVADREHV